MRGEKVCETDSVALDDGAALTDGAGAGAGVDAGEGTVAVAKLGDWVNTGVIAGEGADAGADAGEGADAGTMLEDGDMEEDASVLGAVGVAGGRTESVVAGVVESADTLAADGEMTGGTGELKRCETKEVENSEKEPAVALVEPPPSSSYP